MSHDTSHPIAIPFVRRFRRWRQQFAPILVWAVAVCCLLFLMRGQTSSIAAVGMVEEDTATVAPLMDGAVQSVAVDLLDTVEAGQVVVLMDDSLVAAEVAIAEAELTQLRAALQSEKERIGMELAAETATQQDDLRRFVLNEEAARLDLLDRLVAQETSQIEVQRLGVLLERQEKLLKEGLIDRAAYDETRLSHQAIQTQIKENESSIALAREQLGKSGARRAERQETAPATVIQDDYLAPFKEAVTVQDARIREVNQRRTQLALRAPLSGQVNAILHHPGETLLSGTPILTIVDPSSTRVVAYLDEFAPRSVTRGADVELRSRQNPRAVATAKLMRVGMQVEPMPLRLSRNPVAEQWGIQLLIGEVPRGAFLSGEIVDVRLPQ